MDFELLWSSIICKFCMANLDISVGLWPSKFNFIRKWTIISISIQKLPQKIESKDSENRSEKKLIFQKEY